MRITIASGKGGVGKSLSASLLACFFVEEKEGAGDVVAIDCDVDAPNLALWLGIDNEDYAQAIKTEKISTTEKPFVDEEKCIACGQCVSSCQFGALRLNEADADRIKAEPIPYRCEGCGLCEIVCPQKAITLKPVDNVTLAVFETEFDFPVIQGQIIPGEAESGEAVTELRKIAEGYGNDNTVYVQDAAAGIGCPVIASVVGSDFIVVVAEPTKSSLSDMQRMIELAVQFSIPYGVVVNKHDLNPEMTREIESTAGDARLGRVTYDRNIIGELVDMKAVYTSGLPVVGEVREVYENVLRRCPL